MVIVRTFGDAIVSQELNKEAWKKLSREFKWNEELIPAEQFQGSNLWDALVEKRFDELVEEIMGQTTYYNIEELNNRLLFL